MDERKAQFENIIEKFICFCISLLSRVFFFFFVMKLKPLMYTLAGYVIRKTLQM